MVNLDEMPWAVSGNAIALAGGNLRRGLKISNAISLVFPRDLCKLEEDIII